jgi:hypothetical protein
MVAAPSTTLAAIAISCLRIEFLPVAEATFDVLENLTYRSVGSCIDRVQNFKRALEIFFVACRNITNRSSDAFWRIRADYMRSAPAKNTTIGSPELR